MFGRRSQFGLLAATLTLAFSAFGQASHLSNEANEGAAAPDLNTILTRMGQAQAENRARIHAYSVVREYKLYEEKGQNPKTQLKAKIEFLPPHSKRYDVLDSTGGIGEKVVRRILDHEIAMTRDPAAAEMSPANYDFRLLGTQQLHGRTCYVLDAQPKRPDKNLVKAQIWVDANNFHIAHLEGTPAKDPSFWTRDVHLTLDFGDVNGMWLQTATQATARVRLLGSFNLVGRDQNYQIENESAFSAGTLVTAKNDAPASAVRKKAAQRRQSRSAALVGAGLVP